MNKVAMREIARLDSQLRELARKAKFERRWPDHTSILKDVRPSVTGKGNPSEKTILAVEDGREVAYDGKYEIDLAAIIIDGERYPTEARGMTSERSLATS